MLPTGRADMDRNASESHRHRQGAGAGGVWLARRALLRSTPPYLLCFDRRDDHDDPDW